MQLIKFDLNFVAAIVMMLIGCSSTTQERKIKSIAYYMVEGKADANRAGELFKANTGLYKAENYDTAGNMTRENVFDRDMQPDHVVEKKYDLQHHLIETVTYQNYYNQPHTKTYLTKYVYDKDLLVETLSYYGTFDTTGFWARVKTSYNTLHQKIKDEFTSYNDDADHQTSLYEWKDAYSYTEDRYDKAGALAERHFVQLDKNGRVLVHRMNYNVATASDNSFTTYFETSFDDHGNVLVATTKYENKPKQITSYQYLYEGKNWIYRLQESDGIYFTEFRKITYY